MFLFQAHREVFEYLIEDFKTYKPLLSGIKNEYEMMLAYQRQVIRELEPLKVHQSVFVFLTSKRFLFYNWNLKSEASKAIVWQITICHTLFLEHLLKTMFIFVKWEQSNVQWKTYFSYQVVNFYSLQISLKLKNVHIMGDTKCWSISANAGDSIWTVWPENNVNQRGREARYFLRFHSLTYTWH